MRPLFWVLCCENFPLYAKCIETDYVFALYKFFLWITASCLN